MRDSPDAEPRWWLRRAARVLEQHVGDRGADAELAQPAHQGEVGLARLDGVGARVVGLRGAPWHVRRNYEPKPMARIPYRHVETLDRDAAEVAAIRAAVSPRERLAACDALLVAPRSAEVLAAALEVLVRAVADNRRALLAERAVAPRLRAVVRDTWSTEARALDEAALIAELAAADTVSVRTDPALQAGLSGDGRLGRGILGEGALDYRHGRVTTARVTGPSERLALLQRVTAGLSHALVTDLPTVLMPKDLDAFIALTCRRAAAIDALLEEGRQPSSVRSGSSAACSTRRRIWRTRSWRTPSPGPPLGTPTRATDRARQPWVGGMPRRG